MSKRENSDMESAAVLCGCSDGCMDAAQAPSCPDCGHLDEEVPGFKCPNPDCFLSPQVPLATSCTPLSYEPLPALGPNPPWPAPQPSQHIPHPAPEPQPSQPTLSDYASVRNSAPVISQEFEVGLSPYMELPFHLPTSFTQ
jgi:hypothetical protein